MTVSLLAVSTVWFVSYICRDFYMLTVSLLAVSTVWFVS